MVLAWQSAWPTSINCRFAPSLFGIVFFFLRREQRLTYHLSKMRLDYKVSSKPPQPSPLPLLLTSAVMFPVLCIRWWVSRKKIKRKSGLDSSLGTAFTFQVLSTQSSSICEPVDFALPTSSSSKILLVQATSNKDQVVPL